MKARSLNLFDITMIVVSLVIGMGIFRTPVNVAKAVDSPVIYFAAWIAGGLVALCGALTYAEIGSRLPVIGGYYKVFSYAYHPSIAFGVNCLILVSNAAAIAGVSLIGAEYITGIIMPLSKDAVWLKEAGHAQQLQTLQLTIAIAGITVFYALNLFGLKMSARAQNLLMMLKILLLLALITPLFFATAAPAASVVSQTPPAFLEYLKAFGVGLVAVSFTYGGYQQTINFGAEVNNAQRNLPRGIFFGITIIIFIYLAINYAYVKVIGFSELKNSTNIAAIMASKIFGLNAERILSVLLFFGVLGYINVSLMSNPRVMAAMSDDRILPPAFARKSNSTGSLVTALSVFAALSLLIVFWAEKFDTILSFSIFLDCFGMILSAGSIFIIRKRTANLNGTGIYSMKLYPLLPLIFIAAYTFVAISLLITKTDLCLIGIAVLAGFIGIYFLVRGTGTNKSS